MERQYAFVDEFGNPNLDLSVKGATSHFIVAAVIISESKISLLNEELEKIRKHHFQTGEIRSRLVGRNDKRRKRILKELAVFDFNIVGLVVDKSKIESEGLTWKRSFYKFINGLLYCELYRAFPNLKLSVDALGTKEFMDSFKLYVERRHIPDLFNQADFGFVPSRSSLLIQAADFVCGSLARCFDRTVKSTHAPEFMAILEPRVITISEWPHKFTPLTHDMESEGDSEVDAIIANIAQTSATQFVADNENSTEPDVMERVRCVKFLLFHYKWVERYGWVSTHSIIRNLCAGKKSEMKERHLRSRIIAPLRDAGLLVASSSKGYKLPANHKDLIEFLNHSNIIIRPIIERIKKCRESVLLATKKKFDMFTYPEFEYLKDLELDPRFVKEQE